MHSVIRRASLAVVALAALAGCHKEKGTLEGPAPDAAFTASVDATQYPATVTFTNKTTDAFLYQWDFGDGSAYASTRDAKHTYKSAGGTFRVKLSTSGRGGTTIAPEQVILIPDLCGTNPSFVGLTRCDSLGATSWIYSNQPGAIKKYASNGTTLLSSSGTLPTCQTDDEFSFTSSFAYSYSPGPLRCTGDAPKDNFDFAYRPATNQIVLQAHKGGFIGLADTVVNKTYTIVQASRTVLELRSTNYDGTITDITLRPQLSKLERTKALLTNGSSRTWVLDNGVTNPIVVGTEAAPESYYPNGVVVPAGSLPSCQADDEYTFTNSGNFIYDAMGQTFVAGAYSCQAPRNTQTTFTFGAATGTGEAQFTLNQAGAFIGVTDAPASRVYRILSIDNTTMILRAGRPNDDPVFTIKMHVK